MRKRILGLCLIAVAAIGWPLLLSARRQMDQSSDGEDKYVRLMSAQSVKLLEIDGRTYRKADGPARFLHNNTWLICDTALWDVDLQIIYATGNVSIEQENTELTSDKLTYFVERNLAEFRGSLVQLRDKDNNVLRAHNLDYNTKDSIATFQGGGAMRDKDGQLIESLVGDYKSKEHLFTFTHEVNMFTDSVFIKTEQLLYDSKTTVATFPEYVEAWKDDSMISASSGSYNRTSQYFSFIRDVHMMTETREGWSDTLYYDRGLNILDLKGNAQVVDEERSVSSMAGHINYVDSTSLLTMLNDPVVIAQTQEKVDSLRSVPDSVYFRADTIIYWTVPRWKVDSVEVVLASSRLEQIADDPVMNIRVKAAEEAAKRAEEAAKNDPNRPPEPQGNGDEDASEPQDAPQQPELPILPPLAADSLGVASDSLGVAADSLGVATDSLGVASDSLGVASDSLGATAATPAKLPKDTTKIGFVRAVGKVKVLRNSMQVACDSLVYSDVDSLARLYKEPLIWNEKGRHQYQADSVWVVVKNNKMEKANLMSNAFISINEDNVLYDQIRSVEMSAYFDEDSQLRRFDAMGDATALFYIKEKEKLSTANKKESSILSAMFEKGELQSITYFENPKSDVFPIAQMKASDKQLKGFKWQGDLRPKVPLDITSRVLRESQRSYYASRPKASFVRTSKYFPGYIEKVYREIARADSLRKARSMAKPDTLDSSALAAADSLALVDSLLRNVVDSLNSQVFDDQVDVFGETEVSVDRKFLSEIGVKTASDSLAAVDSSGVVAVPTKKELDEKRKAEAAAKRAALKAERDAAREKRWEELDLRDSMKQAARDAKKHDRLEAKKAKQLARLQARKAREDAIREKYKQLYLTKWKNKLLKSTTTGSGAPSSSL